MQSYRIDNLTWSFEPDDNQLVRVEYKLAGDPDVPLSYTLVSAGAGVTPSGAFISPVFIDNFNPQTNYTIKYTNTAGGNPFYEEILSTTPIEVGSFLDKETQWMPNMQVENTSETGLLDSYLPEDIGFLYQLKGNLRDILDNFGNFQMGFTDEDLGAPWVKKDNEIGISITSNVTYAYPDPTDDSGTNQASIIGPDGKRPYNIGVWFYFSSAQLASSGVDGKLWIWYCGDPGKHIGLYVDTTTKYVVWEHVNLSNTEQIIIDHAVVADQWHRVFVRRDGNNPSDSYSNQILMRVGSSYYSPSTPTYFTSATDFAGDNTAQLYLGFGKQNSNGNLIRNEGIYKYFYFRGNTVADNNIRERCIFPPYPYVIVRNLDDSDEYTIPFYYFAALTNAKAAFVVPHDVPTGSKEWFFETSTGPRTIRTVNIIPFTKRTTTLDIDFTDEDNFEDNKQATVDSFYGMYKSWGGDANAGVVADNIYFQDNKLVLEAHGDLYDGNVQGVNRDGTYKFHTIADDPIFGTDPKYGQPWTNRVGCVMVSKEYFGFGRYLVRTKVPHLLGVAPAWWTFHYEEVYAETPDYELLLAEGLKREGNSSDGYYLVRNHEIDIEQPSHLAMGVFNGWLEVESNVIFFYVNPQYHIGIQNDTQSSANNGLWRYNGTGNPNARTNWTKVSDTVAPIYQPTQDNAKFNTWIGETGSGSGNRYKDPSIPDTQNDEVYLANLTPIGFFTNDDQFHDFEWRWYADRVEFYIDGVLKQTNTAYIPDIPSRLTIGPWFPSGTSSNGSYAPWLPDPMKTWAGSNTGNGLASWNFEKFVVERILFEPYDDTTAGGSNRLIGESYPFDGMKDLTL